MSKEEVIKKIQKLLAMSQANGASENEAMMAASKVQQLLQEHNLSLGEIKDNKTIEDIDWEKVEIDNAKWKGWIRQATAELYFCTTYNDIKFDNDFKRVKVAVFVGRESNRIVAKSMYDYFINTVERMSDNEFKNVAGSKAEINKMSFNFKMGCALSLTRKISEKLQEVKSQSAQNNGNLPMLYKNELQLNRNWLLEKKKVKLKSGFTSRINIKDREAYSRGQEKGNKISLNTQVNNQTSSRLLS